MEMKMKNYLKKFFSLFLFGLLVFAFIGCAVKVDVEFSIDTPNRIQVGEKANISLVVNVDDYDIVEIKSSNSNVLEYANNAVEGISVGSAQLEATILFDKKEYKASATIEVYEEKKYELEVSVLTELKVGDLVEANIKEKYSNINITDFNILSENESIVKIENGKLKAVAAGTVKVIFAAVYENENLSKEVTIVVSDNNVVAEKVFAINLPEKIYAGQLLEIEVKFIPNNTVLEDFEIESSDTDCFEYYPEDFEAQTYEAGNVTLTVSAIVDGKSYSQIFNIVVLPELSLEIDLPSEITTKEPVPFKVYINPEHIEITDYSIFSTNLKAFTVENGLVTPIEVGKGLISISCVYDGAKFSESFDLSVVRYYPETIDSNIQDVMFINESIDTLVTIEPLGTLCTDFTVVSSDNEVISVSNKTIKALKEGSAVVTVTANGLEKKYQINVVTFGNIELKISETISEKEVVSYQVIATPSNLEIKNFKYESNNNDVILINKNLIFAKSDGEATITVSYTYNDLEYKVSKVVESKKVEYPIERLYISGANGILVGTTTELVVNKYPSVGYGEIEFSSSDSSIASVNNGTVTGIKEGKAIITATVKDTAIKASFEVTIIKKNELSEVNDGIYNGNSLVARYYEDNIKLYHELMGGVKQTTYIGYTSTQMSGDVDGYSGMEANIVADQYYQQQVNVLEIPADKDIKVIPWANFTNNKWNLTTVRGLVENFEALNPGYRVVAAVNGDFFDINAHKNLPYSTTGENISDGEFYKTSNGFGSGGGTIGFTNDGSTTTLIGGGHAVFNTYMTLAVYDDLGNIIKEFKVEKINDAPLCKETSVYYGTYNANKEYVAIESLENNTWVVGNAELALPSDTYDFYGKGVIDQTGKILLQKGQFAISSGNPEVIEALSVGKKIRVQFEIADGDKYENVTSATGYNCCIYDETHDVNYTEGNVLNRAPRTVIGQKADGTLVMMVVDGRQGAFGMFGCDGYEITAIMRAYGCIKAYNVDGGGSSTMVVRTDSGLLVTNSPSDGRERSDGNCILICVADPSYETEVSNVTSDSATISVKSSIDEFNDKDLYINLDGTMYPVVAGKVDITGLVHNCTYSYRVYYKEKNEFIATQSVGVINTLQSSFRFLGLTIEETETSFIIHSYSDDVDKCGNISEMTVNINDFDIFLKNGTATVLKKNVGDKILSIYIEYWYINNGERQNVKETDPVYFVIK